MIHEDHVAKDAPDIVGDQLQKLQSIFPEVFTEGKVDFVRLRATLGDLIDGHLERYNFSWAGKNDCIRLLQSPSRATLIPSREESVEFDVTKNVFIEGDNLEVLKLLYKPYFGRVKMIYIDPPYNTGNDFIYPDNYADPLNSYLRLTGQADETGNILITNPETSGRYHSSWLSMMYPRLFIARQLLREDGVIFVSIDDHEIHNLRMLMNEVFGEENFIATVIWHKIFSPKNTAKHFSEDHDYVVIYARNATLWNPNTLPRTKETDARYSNRDNDPRGAWSSSDLTARNYYSEGRYEVTTPSGKKYEPSIGTYWRVNYSKFQELDKDNRVWWGENGDNMPRLKRFLSEVKQGIVPQTLWKYDDVGHTQEAKKELLEFVSFENTDNVLDTPKPTRLIQRMIWLTTAVSEDDVVLDFFAGSCATAHAVLNQNRDDGGNRRFICVQLPEPLPIPESKLKTIADIGKERIRRAAAKLQNGDNGQQTLDTRSEPEDLGFKVFKLAESNYRRWTGVEVVTPESYAKQMELFAQPLVDGWTAENVIYEVAIKEGFGLNCRMEQLKDIRDNTVYRVTDPDKDQFFYVCLDDELNPATPKKLELDRDELFICLDASLDDTMAANLALQCRLKTI